MHNVFISYHHQNDQYYKDALLLMNKKVPVFIDGSVDTGDISDDLMDETIRVKIRDEYLRQSSVTIVLIGTETKRRKHVDWEIISSMIDSKVNRKSGIIVISLPSTNCPYYNVSHDKEKETVYPENKEWVSITERQEYERRYPYLPDRIIDNLLKPEAKISVTNWNRIENNTMVLSFLIESAYNDRLACIYDTSRPMRRHNS